MKLLPLALLCVLTPIAGAQVVDVTTLGAKPDLSDPVGTTAAFALAFNNYPGAKIVVPQGNYAIDNSQTALTINNFTGQIEFENQAQLVFQSTAHGGWFFIGGSNIRIRGLHGTYAGGMPTVRTAEEFAFTGVTDLTVEDSIAENSPGMGFLFTLCVRPKATNIVVRNAVADGLAFANSTNAQLVNYTSDNTIDNGLAFYSYNSYEDQQGGSATNLHISNVTGAHGICVAGTSNVVISDFVIENTRGDGIWVSQDPVWDTRPSHNVVIQHGVVYGAGTIPPITTTNFGIEYTDSDNVLFSDIEIVNGVGRGVSGRSPNGHIRFHNIRVTNNQSSDAFIIGLAASVEIADCVSENSADGGFSFDGTTSVVARNLKVINAQSQNGEHRAFWFQNGKVITATDLIIMNDAPGAGAYIVGTSETLGQPQTGTIQGIVSAMTSGGVEIQANSPGVKFLDVN